jgi:hypothetical protein
MSAIVNSNFSSRDLLSLKMTVKETLAEALREAGYDFITAYEDAHKAITEFLHSNERSKIIGVMAHGKAIKVFELKKK